MSTGLIEPGSVSVDLANFKFKPGDLVLVKSAMLAEQYAEGIPGMVAMASVFTVSRRCFCVDEPPTHQFQYIIESTDYAELRVCEFEIDQAPQSA